MGVDVEIMQAIEAYGNARLRMGAAVAQGHTPSMLRAERESASTLEALEALIAALPPAPHGGAEAIKSAFSYWHSVGGGNVVTDHNKIFEAGYRAALSPPQEHEAAPKGEAVACAFCKGSGTQPDWVGDDMRCIEVACERCGGTGTAPPSPKAEPEQEAVAAERELVAPPLDEQDARNREVAARAECEMNGIDPDELCADGGITAWMVVDQQLANKPAPAPPSPKGEPVEQPYSVAEHIAHDIREGRFPARSTIEQFKAERAPKTEPEQSGYHDGYAAGWDAALASKLTKAEPEQETVAAEREACAKLVETAAEPYVIHSDTGAMMFRACTEKLAAAIRARGQRATQVQP